MTAIPEQGRDNVAAETERPVAPLELFFEGQSFRVKVRACKKTDEQPALPFRIEGRFQNLSRAQRERVLRND